VTRRNSQLMSQDGAADGVPYAGLDGQAVCQPTTWLVVVTLSEDRHPLLSWNDDWSFTGKSEVTRRATTSSLLPFLKT